VSVRNLGFSIIKTVESCQKFLNFFRFKVITEVLLKFSVIMNVMLCLGRVFPDVLKDRRAFETSETILPKTQRYHQKAEIASDVDSRTSVITKKAKIGAYV
jgi:hypothetical protein